MSFRVSLSRQAREDLGRLFDSILERELAREGGDLELKEQAIAATRAGLATLRVSPLTCRKTGQSPFARERVIPFGGTGYVSLFEIEDSASIVMVAVRHQLEDDYY